MSEICKGFTSGLSMDEVPFYADSEYKNEQMRERRTGFENGLTVEQIREYAFLDIPYWEMEKTRNLLERSLKKENRLSVNDKLDNLTRNHKLSTTVSKDNITL